MKNTRKLTLAAVALLTAFSFPALPGPIKAREAAQGEPGNVLVLILDDVGIDRIRAYGYTNAQGNLIAPLTANIDQLAGEGVLFRNAWAAPACSTARGAMLTGMYPNRVGVGAAIGAPGGPLGLRDDFATIADVIPTEYRTAIIGKWHVAGPGPLGSLSQGLDHAPRCGFNLHVGTFANIGSGSDYMNWTLLQALASGAVSETQISGEYATTRTTDDALRSIDAFGNSPWFVIASFNAAHTPHHIPPAALIQSQGHPTNGALNKGKLMIEALDTEIGRLLNGIAPDVRERTTVILFGDNGTMRDVVEAPFPPLKAKGSIYNGGIHVPMIISSPATPAGMRGMESNAIIDITDLMPTAVELLGGALPAGLDGCSLVPYLSDPSLQSQRPWIYAEKFKPNFIPTSGSTISSETLTQHHQAARGDRYKVIRRWPFGGLGERLEMYDLETDFFESTTLLDAQSNPPAALQAEFNRLLRVIRKMAE